MPLTRIQKQKILDELKEKVDRQKAIAFADISGLRVRDLTELRKEMKKNNCELKVAKKTLIGLILKESPLFTHRRIEVDFKKIKGEVALGFGYKDEISPFRIFHNFSKDHESLQMLGGLVGQELMEKERAVELAKLPGREELLAQLLFVAKLQLWGIFNVFQRNLSILKVRT